MQGHFRFAIVRTNSPAPRAAAGANASVNLGSWSGEVLRMRTIDALAQLRSARPCVRTQEHCCRETTAIAPSSTATSSGVNVPLLLVTSRCLVPHDFHDFGMDIGRPVLRGAIDHAVLGCSAGRKRPSKWFSILIAPRRDLKCAPKRRLCVGRHVRRTSPGRTLSLPNTTIRQRGRRPELLGSSLKGVLD
jgi:hypothetical protein